MCTEGFLHCRGRENYINKFSQNKNMTAKYNKLPITESFFVTSIIGFLICVIYTYSGWINLSFGFAFSLVFLMMFIASLIAITPDDKELETFK
jgi:predicted ABC-type exoprotein transport system permease subunit